MEPVGGTVYGSEEALLERLASLARRLAELDTVQETAQGIVDLAHDLIDGAEGASLMLAGRHGTVSIPAWTSELAQDGGSAQRETGQGPCLTAIRDEHSVVIADLGREERWPDFRGRALGLGVRSMLSLQLFVTGDSIGALDVYSRQVQAFEPRSRLVGQMFAAQASVALKAALTRAGLEAAVRSRDVIGQAKGIMMARSRLTAPMAASYLKWLSQQRNQPLREVASHIARTGEIPDP